MSKLLEPPILIVGIGNDASRDNAAGLVVTRQIAQTLEPSPDITFLEMDGEGHALMEAWNTARTVLLIDAVQLGDLPGTLYYFDLHKQPLPADRFYHTPCAFNFIDAIELAKSLHQLPPIAIIYGIERATDAPGSGLSQYVGQTVEVLSALLRDWAQVYQPYAVA